MLAHVVVRAGETLRRDGRAAGHLSAFLHTNPFKGGQYYGNPAGGRPPSPTDYTPELLHLAGRCLDRVFRPGFAYQKCGVMLAALVPATTAKGHLFDDRDRAKERRLMAAVDAVNARSGAGALGFAQATPPPGPATPSWTPRAAMSSPHYTTAWADLPVVR